MGFYRLGASAARANERDNPQIVEMVVPAAGFAHHMRTAMDEFHRTHNIRPRFGRRFRRDGKEYCRWCFADALIAERFHSRFGGEGLVNGAGHDGVDNSRASATRSRAKA